MTCAERRPQLTAYVDHELPEAERAELESHLAGCPTCAAALEAERHLSSALAALPAVEPPRDFEARFWARIARSKPSRWRERLFTRRLALGFGGAAVAALAALFALRGSRESDADLQIVANAEDYELLEDPDLDVILVVDVLEDPDGDPG